MAVFQGLSEKLNHIFSKMTKKGRLTELEIKQAMREVRIALLEADVNLNVAKDFIAKVSEKAVGQEILKSLSPAQQVIKIVNEELTELMGATNSKLIVSPEPPTVIMMCGLQGAGKTTLCGKLAVHLKKQGKKPLLAACDVYRPAAINQLKIVGEKAGADVFEKGQGNPVRIAAEAVEHAKKYGYDTVIVDTAGRLHIDEALMEELENITKAIRVDEILLTVDSMTGQDAVNTAKEFNDRLDFDGVVLTKLDGDTRGGAAISIRAVVNKPLKFISSGEKMDALQVFHPERMADRILGMGDIVSLVEKAQEQYDEEEARRLKKKLVKNQFDFNDFLTQISQIKKMGNLKDLAGMIPGVGKMLKNVEINDDVFKQTEAIIHSMTPAERADPSIINGSRRQRIATGSGTTMQDVNRLLKQFEDTRKVMKSVAGGMPKMPKGFNPRGFKR